MLLVMANESSTEQTEALLKGSSNVVRAEAFLNLLTRSSLERGTIKSDSLVGKSRKENALLQEYGWSNFQPEYGSHLELILNTNQVR